MFYRRGDFRVALGKESSPYAEIASRHQAAERQYFAWKCAKENAGDRSHFAQMYRSAWTRAKRLNREFTITVDDLREMLVEQDWRCALTGVKFSLQPSSASAKTRPFAPSIDRIDNHGGYTRQNVRLVIGVANLARNAYSDEEFYTMCLGAVEKRYGNKKVRQIVGQRDAEQENPSNNNGLR